MNFTNAYSYELAALTVSSVTLLNSLSESVALFTLVNLESRPENTETLNIAYDNYLEELYQDGSDLYDTLKSAEEIMTKLDKLFYV